MNSQQEEIYLQILNHAEQIRNELSTMPIAPETDIRFIEAVDMLNEIQAAYQLQQTKLDKAISALESIHPECEKMQEYIDQTLTQLKESNARD